MVRYWARIQSPPVWITLQSEQSTAICATWVEPSTQQSQTRRRWQPTESSTKLRDPIYQKLEDLRIKDRWQTKCIKELQEENKQLKAEARQGKRPPRTKDDVFKARREGLSKLNGEMLTECRVFCEANQTAGRIVQTMMRRWMLRKKRPLLQKHGWDTLTARLRDLFQDGFLTRIEAGVYKLASPG